MRSRIAVVALIMVLALTGCRVQAPSAAPVAKRAAAVTTGAPLLQLGATSTTQPTTFGGNVEFAADSRGNGKAVARFVPPLRASHAKSGWNRIAKFVVYETKLEGVWVQDLTFFGRMTGATVITRNVERAMGSGKFHTVTTTVADILRTDPKWEGPTPDAPASIVFKVDRNSPVLIVKLTELDPVHMTVTLPDAGPAYARTTSDPIVKAALSAPPGGSSASIVGYLVDYMVPGKGQLYEAVVSKAGVAYRQTGFMGNPPGAFGAKAAPRAQPESDAERQAREAAITRAQGQIARINPVMATAQPQVFEYIVRVKRFDGTTVDISVSPSGDAAGSDVYGKLPVVPVTAGVR